MGNVFVISDTHFYHSNVIKFDKRPFKSMEEMNETLIDNWNKTVSDDDTVISLGDFCWLTGSKPEYKELLERLKGEKIMIYGNHDVRDLNKEIRHAGRIREMTDYKELKYCGKKIIMSHYPIPFYRSAWCQGIYHLFGHVHRTKENDYMDELQQKLWNVYEDKGDNRAQWLNVGCMMPWMDYRPILLDGAIKLIDDRNPLPRSI